MSFQAILALLGALPSILAFVSKLIELGDQGGDVKGFFQRLNDNFERLKAADTPEKKSDAAKDIADYIADLHR